jgi:hypothetical protein
MVTINYALARVKADLAKLLDPEAILENCRRIGHDWRRSLLNPATTLHLFIMQILAGNTACHHLRHLSGLGFTASAYCQARAKLPLKLIQDLARQVGQRLSVPPEVGSAGIGGAGGIGGTGLWRGHRLFLVDGTGCSMPDTPELRRHFGQPGGQKKGCGFPVASALLLMHAASGAILDMLLRPLRVHDMSGVAQLHADLHPGDVLMGDRAFCSYAHLALLRERELHGIFRLHQKTIISFRYRRRHAASFPKSQRQGKPTSRWVGRLGFHDQQVEYFKPQEKPDWMSPAQFEALPESMVLREICCRIPREGFRVQEVTLLTTLLDPETYPAAELAQRFLERWRIEGNIDHLKTTMGAAVLHCRTVAGVTRELWVFILTYNLIRQVMIEASRRQEVDAARISFIDALRWIAGAAVESELGDLVVNPLREGRFEPRVIKRRMKQYPLMTRPRAVLKQEMTDKRVAA